MATFHKERSPLPVRIHHGYVGLALVAVGHWFVSNEHLIILGWALFLSDVTHHFVVLPVWVGRTEFP